MNSHRYAVIEMGANHAGEIAYTSTYTQADVVIITNAGAAHIEGFGSLDGVAKAKGEIIETLKKDELLLLIMMTTILTIGNQSPDINALCHLV